MTVQKKLAALAAIALLGATLAGCSTPTDDGPVTLQYWSDSNNIDKVVAVWNEANPDIQVELTNPGGKDEIVAKLLAAIEGGDAPDIADVSQATLSQLVVGGGALDITEYVEPVADAFSQGSMDSVTLDGVIYGVPFDVGPLMFVYNKAAFDAIGITPPSTWEEFTAAAETVRATGAYIAQFDLTNNLFFTGMVQQAGGDWWSVDGGEWTVDINSDASKAVAAYWQDLIDRDLVSTAGDWTPEWSAALNDGTILTGPMAIWGAGSVNSLAPEALGEWAIAPIPSWEGSDVVGLYGGSASIITSSSEKASAAAEFITWMLAGEGANEIGKTQYPAAIAAQEQLSSPPAIFAEQADFYVVASAEADRIASVTWGPNTTVAFRSFSDNFTAAIQNGTLLVDALDIVQEDTVADMEDKGFTVNEG
jgi:multiple sugar transport system substrate-binding protein